MTHCLRRVAPSRSGAPGLRLLLPLLLLFLTRCGADACPEPVAPEVDSKPTVTIDESRSVRTALSEGKPPRSRHHDNRISVVGVSVQRGFPSETSSRSPSGDIFRGHHSSAEAGTKVEFLLYEPDQTLIALDEAASSVLRFSDDRGGDLTAGSEVKFMSHWVSENGHALRFELHSPRLPSPKTTQLHASAKVVYRVVQKSETISVDVPPGQQVDRDLGVGTVTLVREDDPSGTMPSPQTRIHIDDFKDYQSRVMHPTFYDGTGQQIMGGSISTSFTYSGDARTMKIAWQLALTPGPIRADFVVREIRTERVSLDVLVGLGTLTPVEPEG